MKEYYIYINQQEGPFTIEELRSKNISNQTPAWHDGLSNWTIVGEIPELISLVKVTPPPFERPTPPPFHTPNQSDYEYELEMAEFFAEKKKFSWGLISWVTLLVVSFALLLWAMNRN